MTKKIKEPKEIIYVFRLEEDEYTRPIYLCPTCLNEVKNKDHICKYCNEELKEKK